MLGNKHLNIIGAFYIDVYYKATLAESQGFGLRENNTKNFSIYVIVMCFFL